MFIQALHVTMPGGYIPGVCTWIYTNVIYFDANVAIPAASTALHVGSALVICHP